MARDQSNAVTVALLVLVAGLPLAGSVTASHGSPVNATAVWGEHDPGAKNVTLTAFANGAAESADSGGLKVWKNFTTVAPAGIGYSCVPARDTRAAGIDRENDDPGTETDVSMLGKFKYYTTANNSEGQTELTIVFYDEDDFGGDTIHINDTDQLVAKFASCWHLPGEPGWYRNYGHVNGTGWDDEYEETDSFSHWYYVCKCDSYDDAVNTLGEPPSGNLASSDQKVGRMAGPHYLTELRGSATSTRAETVAPDGTTPGTPTPVKATTTATPRGGQGATSPTATVGDTTARSTTHIDETTATVTTTALNTRQRAGTLNSPTETNADGPGFGVVAALFALLAAVVVARR